MINKLFNKLDSYIDYNNHYSINKALRTLEKEFNIAMNKKDIYYARAVIGATKSIYDKLSSSFRESQDLGETMSYSQKVLANKMRAFISYLILEMKSGFGISDNEQEIEQTIGQ